MAQQGAGDRGILEFCTGVGYVCTIESAGLPAQYLISAKQGKGEGRDLS